MDLVPPYRVTEKAFCPLHMLSQNYGVAAPEQTPMLLSMDICSHWGAWIFSPKIRSAVENAFSRPCHAFFVRSWG